MFQGIPQRSLSASLVDLASPNQLGHMNAYSSEQAFIESLEAIISSSGSTQGHCIAQLRSLGLPDDFWMFVFKVVPCAKTYSHKWTLCPCAHAGETARRRDPRVVNYRAILCPIVKAKKTCPLGDACGYAHNVFEHWLHPSRYKTRLCSFGRNCNRPICFFAHSAEELRCVPNTDDGKEVDEREYMLQVMMAQQADPNGLLGGRAGLGSISSPTTPLNSLHHQAVSAFCTPTAGASGAGANPFANYLDAQVTPNMGSGGPGSGLSSSQMASLLSPVRSKSMTPNLNGMHLNAPHGMQPHDSASLQLLGLQEALAAMNLTNPTPLDASAQGRGSSDPGIHNAMSQQLEASKVLSSLNSLGTRLSDAGAVGNGSMGGLASGNGLGGLESLLPFMTSALQVQQAAAAAAAAQQAPQTPGAHMASMGSQEVVGTPLRSAPSGFGPSGPPMMGGMPGGPGMGMGFAPPTPTQHGSLPVAAHAASPPQSPGNDNVAPSGGSNGVTAAGVPVPRSQSPAGSVGGESGRGKSAGSPAGSPPRSADGSQHRLARQMSEGMGSLLGLPLGGAPPASSTGANARHAAAMAAQQAADVNARMMRQDSGPALLSMASGGSNSNLQTQQAQAAVGVAPQQQAAALQALLAAAGGVGGAPNGLPGAGVPPAAMKQLMANLQEQGLADSKDQLVASLSQLLAQLLSSNN